MVYYIDSIGNSNRQLVGIATENSECLLRRNVCMCLIPLEEKILLYNTLHRFRFQLGKKHYQVRGDSDAGINTREREKKNVIQLLKNLISLFSFDHADRRTSTT